MNIRHIRSCMLIALLVLLSACAGKEIPQPEVAPPPQAGRSGPPVAFESRETFLANLHPANLEMTSWKQLEPVLRDSLRYVSSKDEAAVAVQYPDGTLTWGDMRRTLVSLLELLPRLDGNPALFAENFEWKAVPGGIAYSGYYEPIVRASRIKKPGYEHPIYCTPPDMQRHKRRKGSYYDRRAIDGRRVLEGKGLELAWAADPVDVFFLQIQGSGRLAFDDGGTVCVNYDSQNGHKYRSSGRIMAAQGLLSQGHIFEQRAWFKDNPHRVNDILFENPSYVFFKFGTKGAIGAMGYELAPWASLATDRTVIPLGSVVAYGVNIPDQKRGEVPLRAVGVAQDVGGAIKKNRIDIFCGAGFDGEYVASHLDKRGPAWVLVARTPSTAPEQTRPLEMAMRAPDKAGNTR